MEETITNTYARAYTEVYEILNYLDESEISKIPKEDIEFFAENRDKEYEFKIDTTKDLYQQEFSNKTYAIIISLFRDYIATDVQKEEINKALMHNQEIIEAEKREKYNPENIFNKPIKEHIQVKEISEEPNEVSLEVKKENIFQKFINYIKSLFIK